MDAYEATRIVFSRIQKLDHENAAKIMGLLLIQDHGEKEMIRLAFGPEALLHSLVLRSQKELGLLPSSSPATPSSTKGQNSAPFLPFLFNEGGNAALRAKSSELYYTDASGAFGWRPCLYFARGFCKNGNACRFLHDDAAAEYKSVKIPYSPTSASAKYLNFLLQNQTDGQRAAAALMLSGGDEVPKYMGRARSDFLGISNAGSRQIYLTFPADSTFREEDVSNYFSIYGPVQDVRIPYQQKRMFGFVTFLYPETVKLILAKGNPHFVCNARVLVKPYKEKGKVSEKKQQSERLDFSSSWSSPGIDSPLDIGGRMLYSNFCNGGIAAQESMLLRRRLEEQQQAELLQQAIEQQSRRFKLLDLKPTSFSATVSAKVSHPSTITVSNSSFCNEISSPIGALEEESSRSSTGSSTEMQQLNNNICNKEDSEEEPSKEDEDFLFCSSTEHNLPDSPFASPTKSSSFLPSDISFSAFSPLSSCFFQMPARFSSGHGAVGM